MGWSTSLLLASTITLVVFLAYLFGKTRNQRIDPSVVPDLISLYKEIKDLPARVLTTIQGSINPQKGKVAELLTYAQMRFEYDMIIPLGRPIDFIGIKAGERIDFIEVKSGNATLTAEERAISSLVTSGRVNFRLVMVRDEQTRDLIEGDELIITRPLPQG